MVDFNSTLVPLFNNNSDLIAFCALSVSIFSLALTIITLWIQRNHDRLSVRPLAFIHVNNTSGCLSITINNGGLGPMIIKSIETFRTEDPKQKLDWPIVLMNVDIIDRFISSKTTAKLNNTPILNGKSIKIFEHKYDADKPDHVTAATNIKNILKEMTIKIKYLSIYDKQYEANLNLSFFKA